MFAVIFEVQPRADQWDTYLELAALLRPELVAIEGFIDNERFASRRVSGRILSLSTWRHEKALIRWRTLGVHHAAQARGRSTVFADYHLRVGEITSDTCVPQGETLRQERFDVTEVGQAPVVTITEVQPAGLGDTARVFPATLPEFDGAAGLVGFEYYDSLSTPTKALALASWRDEGASRSWLARRLPTATGLKAIVHRDRTVRIIRDYGLFDRHEAPQYYPPVTSAPDVSEGNEDRRPATGRGGAGHFDKA